MATTKATKKIEPKPTKKKAAVSAKPVKKAFPLIGRSELTKLLERCSVLSNKVSTSTGDMGELIRLAADRHHLHTGAFGIIRRLNRMGEKDPGKLWLLLAHFDDMRKKAGLDKIAKAQGQLLPAISEDNGKKEQGDNVVDYPTMPREVEEQAGDAA